MCFVSRLRGRVLLRPDLVYTQGYVRRRLSNLPLDGIRGQQFFELSEAAGPGSSGALNTRVIYRASPCISPGAGGCGDEDLPLPCPCGSPSGEVRTPSVIRSSIVTLESVAGRARPNTLRAVAFDLKTFFSVVVKDPLEVTAVDVFEFLAHERGDRTVLRSC